jgi:hypothetical protein
MWVQPEVNLANTRITLKLVVKRGTAIFAIELGLMEIVLKPSLRKDNEKIVKLPNILYNF